MMPSLLNLPTHRLQASGPPSARPIAGGERGRRASRRRAPRHRPCAQEQEREREVGGVRHDRRRALLGGAAAAGMLSGAACPPAAEALKLVDGVGPEGVTVEAHEFAVALNVVGLRSSVPTQDILDFGKAMGPTARAQLQAYPSLGALWAELKSGKPGNKVSTADTAALGDTWLAYGIRHGLLQPIPDAARYRWWSRLHPRWQELVTRDDGGMLASTRKGGKVWAAPYRWGCMMVAFRQDKLAKAGARPIRDWPDLLQPALAGRIGFVESPRDLVGAAVKASFPGKAGLGYNTSLENLKAAGVSEQALRDAVMRMLRQVRVFNSKEHVRALNADDCWVVVGFSDELIKLAKRSSNLKLAAPLSGTVLWADMWTVPKGAAGGSRKLGPSPLLPLWLDFELQEARAARAKGLQSGSASPLLLPPTVVPPGRAVGDLPPSSAAGHEGLDDTFMPLPDILARSEFLQPLDKSTAAVYDKILRGTPAGGSQQA
eukprot:jgi/Tetstr1/432918/TSEL_022258.t1